MKSYDRFNRLFVLAEMIGARSQHSFPVYFRLESSKVVNGAVRGDEMARKYTENRYVEVSGEQRA